MNERIVLHSRFGRGLTIGVLALSALGLIAVLVGDGMSGLLTFVPVVALVCGLCWAAFWRPSVIVDPAGVTIHNVFSTVVLSWPEIQRIDTRYSLTLVTTHGTVSAWAAPAPGRHSAVFASRDQGDHLPESSYIAGTVRPRDLITSDSGVAAYVIRERWEALRDAGHLDSGLVETTRLRRTGHWATITVLTLLLGLSILAVNLG